MAESGMTITGISNGTQHYQDKNGRIHYSVLVVMPGSEQNIRIGLDAQTDPSKLAAGTKLDMKILPRFYQGRVTGFYEVR